MNDTTAQRRRPRRQPDGASPWSARRRRPRDHEVKREAVIRAAARAFNERGYHHTSLDDIAAALGVTKPTIYYYVANKEQLLFECFLAGLRPIREAPARGRAPARPGARTAGRGDPRLRRAPSRRNTAGAWCAPTTRTSARRCAARSTRSSPRSTRASAACCAPASRTARSNPATRRSRRSRWPGALNWIAHWYRADQPLSAGEIADAFVGFFAHGLLPRRAAAASTRA